MKKIFITSLCLTSIFILSSCNAIKTWWNDLSLTDIANTLAPSIQSASKYGTYAICDKNPDLKPIFIAAANGVKIAVNADAFSTDQIKAYITQALGKENEKWAPVVFSAMDTVLAQYNIIYTKYISEAIDEQDKLNGFRIMLLAISCGIAEGASMQDLTATAEMKAKSIESKRIEANQKLVEQVSKL